MPPAYGKNGDVCLRLVQYEMDVIGNLNKNDMDRRCYSNSRFRND